MLHLHFGAGRLGLGLVAPFFRRPGAELHLFNRATSGANPTGGTGLSPGRRNELLRGHPGRQYVIQRPGGGPADRHPVGYDRFAAYTGADVPGAARAAVRGSAAAEAGVVVTASVLTAANYRPVADALAAVRDLKARGGVGPVFLVACENTVDARDVLADPAACGGLPPAARDQVTPVSALVDRMRVGLEEDHADGHPAVLVRAEEYGSLKLGLSPETEPLADLCRGSRVEFSRHVETEKQIKSWLLNGTHWLVALSAYQDAHGDQELKLNEYLNSDPEHRRFAAAALGEMSEGVAILLRGDPKYAAFVRDVDVDDYLAGAPAEDLGAVRRDRRPDHPHPGPVQSPDGRRRRDGRGVQQAVRGPDRRLPGGVHRREGGGPAGGRPEPVQPPPAARVRQLRRGDPLNPARQQE